MTKECEEEAGGDGVKSFGEVHKEYIKLLLVVERFIKALVYPSDGSFDGAAIEEGILAGVHEVVEGRRKDGEQTVSNDSIVCVGDRDGPRLEGTFNPPLLGDKENVRPVEGAIRAVACFEVLDDLQEDGSGDVDEGLVYRKRDAVSASRGIPGAEDGGTDGFECDALDSLGNAFRVVCQIVVDTLVGDVFQSPNGLPALFQFSRNILSPVDDL